MDGRVKSRGRRSLVKRHRGQPAVRFRCPLRAGSELSRGWAACCSPARQVPIEANRRH